METGRYAYAEFGVDGIALIGEVLGTPVPDNPDAVNDMMAEIQADRDLQREYEERRSEMLDDYVAERDAVRATLSIECTPDR